MIDALQTFPLILVSTSTEAVTDKPVVSDPPFATIEALSIIKNQSSSIEESKRQSKRSIDQPCTTDGDSNKWVRYKNPAKKERLDKRSKSSSSGTLGITFASPEMTPP